MSTYPGDEPTPPGGSTPPGGPAEPPDEQGYWERKAAEERARQAQAGAPGQAGQTGQDPAHPYGYFDPGVTFNPQSATPYGDQQAQQPTYGQPYGQYGQPYGPQPQAQYGPPQGQGYPPPGYPPAYQGFAPRAPDHPKSGLALVLGLIGVFGWLFSCGVTLFVAPFAWAVGRRALTEIRQSNGRLGGEGQARTGMVMGIIGTVLLALVVLGLIVLAIGLIASAGGSSSGTST